MFCTGYESQDGRLEMFVLNLETGLMKQLDAYSAVIPRWRILENGDTAIVYIDQAGLSQKPVWRSYGTWMVTFKNEKFGQPKKIFSGAFSSTSNDFKFPQWLAQDFFTLACGFRAVDFTPKIICLGVVAQCELIDFVVRAAVKNDIYVIIDWHSHKAHIDWVDVKSYADNMILVGNPSKNQPTITLQNSRNCSGLSSSARTVAG